MSPVRKFGVVLVFSFVFSFMSNQNVFGQASLVLQPDGAAGKDACITATLPDTNQGSTDELVTNYSGPNHGVIEFDLSSLPAGATVTGATLEILEHTNCSHNANAIEVHLNSAAWDEATVTWNNAPAYGPSIGANTGETSSCDFLIFDVTGAVQDWVGGTSPNFGFRVTGPSGSNVIKYIYSSDTGTATNRPILTIDYALADVEVPTISEWGMIILSTLIAISAVTILLRRRAAIREV